MLEWALAGIASYTNLFWLCVITGLAIPIPEDLVVMSAGILLHEGQLTLVRTIVVVSLGMWIRDLVAYGLGRVFGDWLFDQWWSQKLFPPRKIERTRQWFHRYGVLAIVGGRLLIGMRVPVFLVAGSMRVGFRRFAWIDGIGVLLTAPVLLFLGYAFGEPLLDGVRWVIQRTSGTAWGLAALGLFVFVWRRTRATDDRASGSVEAVADNAGP